MGMIRPYVIGALYKYVTRKEYMVFIGWDNDYSHFIFVGADSKTEFHYPANKPHKLIYKTIKQEL